MKRFTKFIFIFILLSCADDEPNAIAIVLETVERGAVLRTQEYLSNDFLIDDMSSLFSVLIEEDDIEDGGLLEAVDIYLQYIGNTPQTSLLSTSKILYKTVEVDQFISGPTGRPAIDIEFTFSEALDIVGLMIQDVAVKDQFIVSLDLNLTDGRTFNMDNSSSIIIAYDTFFSSPFCYTINVVEPINETAFTGVYRMESILDSPFDGGTFIDSEIVEVTKGRSNTTRQFDAWHFLHHRGLEQKRRWEFNVVGDETVFGKNQLSSPEGFCTGAAAPLLLGPGDSNGTADPIDDTVFELWFAEGYLGFDGNCGFGTAPSRYRFTKQ